ncbi:MAG: outer membrane protein assembly factor BamD [Victivallaceae bacterium]
MVLFNFTKKSIRMNIVLSWIVRIKLLSLLFAVAVFFATPLLLANDTESSALYQRGLEKYQKGDYNAAAKLFLDAEHMADTVSLKADAVKEAVKSYREGGLLYSEYENIEKLLNSYPGFVDYGKMVDREYEIGNEYFKGYRDPAFWSLRWIPWLTGPDKTITIYESAVKHAPFAKEAPQAKLRLAVLFIEDSKVDKALELLREIIKQYPNSEACKFAYLELGNALFQLSQHGDGDGKYNKESTQVLKEFLKKYPKAPEADWVEKCFLKSKDIQAERLLNIAKFYNRIGRSEPVERYLTDVLKKYPDSLAAENSEEMLTKIDKTYVPEGFRPEVESRFQNYPLIPIPPEPSEIIVVPENSNGKWLLPIKDLGLGNRDKLQAKNEGK